MPTSIKFFSVYKYCNILLVDSKFEQICGSYFIGIIKAYIFRVRVRQCHKTIQRKICMLNLRAQFKTKFVLYKNPTTFSLGVKGAKIKVKQR
jgi:hypothetical protein